MKALILVDLQNDFLPGGSMGVRDGDAVIPLANRLQRHFDLVVATQDWHPANHGSFAANHPGKKTGDEIELNGLLQILWPVHCVQGTPGPELAEGLDKSRIARVFRKGTDPAVDSYSGFFDNGHRHATELAEYLRSCDVDEVYIAGLTTDYCVKFTALDARKLDFRTAVVEDACRGVERNPGDVARAIDEMRQAGVRIMTMGDVLGAAADSHEIRTH